MTEEFTCKDCGKRVVIYMVGELLHANDDRDVCLTCSFIAMQPAEDRDELRKRLDPDAPA